MRFVSELRGAFVEFGLGDLAFLPKRNVAALLVAEFAGSEIFGKEIDAGIKVPWTTGFVVGFFHFVTFFEAFNIVGSGMDEILRDRGLADFLVIEIDDGARRIGGNRESSSNAITCERVRTEREE